MNEYLKKLRKILHSPALSSIAHWSRCVHGKLLLICVMTVTYTLCSLGVTMVTKNLIDGAVSSNTDALRKYAGLLIGLLVSERAVSVGLSVIRVKASAKLQRSLQHMLSQEILIKDYANLKGYHSGELVNRFFSDVNVVKNGVINILPSLVRIGVSFIGASAILISMNWRFVLLLILCGFLGMILVLLFKRPMKTRHKRMQEAEGALHSVTQETFENIRLIKASVSEERTGRMIDQRQDHLEKEQKSQGYFSAAMNNGIGFVFDISWLFCMILGCFYIFRGVLTYGSLAAMIQLIGRIQGPIANAITLAGQVYGVTSSAERLKELADLPPEAAGEPLPDFDTLNLEHVTFQYTDGNEDVLKDLCCSIKRGDFMALTGISGGGKTSLFQLLLGIYHPTSGQVVFRSGNKRVPVSCATRKLFAYVPQGNLLFSGTLRDNLTMFTDHASDEEIAAALHAACIDRLAAEIGLDAMLGERGVGLSEGQAQRVAVARALLSKAPILLLDEATSALDEQTEARMLNNISAMRDKTCIIVTHRRAALSICDYELNITNGRLSYGTEDSVI